jgi:aromatic ring-opening dioxygenase LigB subunit
MKEDNKIHGKTKIKEQLEKIGKILNEKPLQKIIKIKPMKNHQDNKIGIKIEDLKEPIETKTKHNHIKTSNKNRKKVGKSFKIIKSTKHGTPNLISPNLQRQV